MIRRRLDPLWARAPVVLIRYHRLGAAILVAAVVVGMASAVGPLFLSSARNAALEHELADAPADVVGLRVSAAVPIDAASFDPVDEAVRRIVSAATDGLDAGELTLHGRYMEVSTTVEPDAPTRINLLHRTDALDNIEIIDGAGADADADAGSYLPAGLASRLGLGVGDEFLLQRAGRSVPMLVAGTYEDLGAEDVHGYWRPYTGLIIPLRPPELGGQPPPPLVLVPRETFIEAMSGFDVSVPITWTFPLAAAPGELTMSQAQELSAAYAHVDARVHTRGEPVYEALRSYEGPRVGSALTGLVRNVTTASQAFEGSVHLLTLAARAVGLIVVAATAMLVVRARRNEIRRAWASGATSPRLGARLAVEALLPVAIGAVAGGMLAGVVVSRLGPSPTLDPGVARDAAVALAGAALFATALFAVVAAFAVRRTADERGARLGAVSRTPWELLVLVLAAASFAGIATRRSVYAETTGEATQLDALAVAFPLLFLIGVVGLAVRGLSKAVPRLRTVGASSPPQLLLAVRRFAAAGGIGLVLLGATAIAFGVGSFAATTAASTQRTIELKSLTAVGAQTSARVSRSAGAALDASTMPFPASVVRRTSATVQPGGRDVDLLVVDPDSLRAVVEWDEAFGAGLQRTVEALRGEAGEGQVAVVSVGSALPEAHSIEAAAFNVDGRVALRLDAFPGWGGQRPLVVVDAARLDGAATHGSSSIPAELAFTYEVWADADLETTRSALLGAEAAPARLETADDIRRTPTLLGLGWTLDLFTAIGLAMVVLGAVGIVLYARSRQRETEIAYVLMRRMGLRRGAHRWALAAELGALLALAAIIGGAAGLLAAWLLNAPFDPLAGQPPAPRFVVPGSAATVAVAVIGVAALMGSWTVQRAADRARETEVLRLAG